MRVAVWVDVVVYSFGGSVSSVSRCELQLKYMTSPLTITSCNNNTICVVLTRNILERSGNENCATGVR